jgi:hypothetical protein
LNIACDLTSNYAAAFPHPNRQKKPRFWGFFAQGLCTRTIEQRAVVGYSDFHHHFKTISGPLPLQNWTIPFCRESADEQQAARIKKALDLRQYPLTRVVNFATMIKSIIGGQRCMSPLPRLEELAMKKLPASKITILMVVLVLMGSSVACRITEILQVGYEAARETCIQVSQARYERAAKELGETPRTPKDPENAVYEVCYIEDELYSVRMSEGYSDRDEDENVEPEKSDREQKTESMVDVPEIPNPVSQYMGETGWSMIYDPIEVREDQFVLVVDNDGNVSGVFMFDYITQAYEHEMADGDVCTTQYHFAATISISGQLVDNKGTLTSDYVPTICKHIGTCSANIGCPGGQRPVYVEIINGKLEGHWIFEEEPDLTIPFTGTEQ